MPQIKTGTVSLEYGNATVVADGGQNWSGVDAPAWFTRVGTAIPYFVAGPATFVSGAWRVDLTAPYGGTTEDHAPYVIHDQFGPDDEPIMDGGDTEVRTLFNAAMAILYQRSVIIGGGGGGTSFQPTRQVIALSSGTLTGSSTQATAIHSIKVTLAAGAYTGIVALPVTGLTSGDRAEIRIEFAVTAGTKVQVRSATSGGTIIFERTSIDPSEVWKLSALCTGTAWEPEDAHQVI